MINNKYFKNEVFNNNSIVEIPKDWEVKKTGDLLNGVVGTTPPKKDPNNFIGNLEWINISDMGSYLINSEKTVNRNAKGVKNRIIEQNSLLYSFKLSVGEIGFNKNEAMTNEAIISFSPSKNKNVNLKYFYYVLKKYLHLNTGANVYGAPIMNQEKIKDADLIVTEDKKEQNKIVEILDKQQSLIDSYKEKLSLLEEQESYYQDELLSGRIRIKLNSENENVAIDKGFIVNGELVESKEKEFEKWLSVDFKDKVEFYKEEYFNQDLLNNKELISYPVDWSLCKLNSVLKGIVGMTPPKKDPNNYIGNLKWINISDLGDNFVGYKKTVNPNCKGVSSRIIEKGSLLYSFKLSVGLIGFSKYKDMMTNEAIISFEPSKNNSLNYFYYVLKKYLHLNAGSNVYGAPIMNQEKIKNSDLIITNNLLERELITFFFKKFNETKKCYKEKIKIEEEKMDYLMDELLSGRIRVE